jgi:hypothetical protein
VLDVERQAPLAGHDDAGSAQRDVQLLLAGVGLVVRAGRVVRR